MGDVFITRRGGGKRKFPTGIAITTPPAKTSYNAGESINLSGMVVTATYSDGSTENITSECTFTPANGAVVYESTTRINVTWTWEGINYTTSYPITVARVLSSIAITTNPSKMSYTKGETLNLSGMVVRATYNSGATANVTGYTTSPAAGATLSTLGTQTVTVSYAENGVTKTTSFTVSVSIKTVTWSGGTDSEIADMVAAADRGEISLADYWAVGDTRTVTLAAMSATGVGESQASQQVDFVLMHAGGYNLNAAVASGRTKCSFVVGMKDCLATAGYMKDTNTNSGSWNGSKRRTWCNSAFRDSIPSTLIGIFKQFKTVTAKTYNGTTNQTSIDYFALPAPKEVFGGSATSAGSATSYSNLTEFNALFQFEWYKTSSNRIKKLGKTGYVVDYWWERSPRHDNTTSFCTVDSNGRAVSGYASADRGISPFGCI